MERPTFVFEFASETLTALLNLSAEGKIKPIIGDRIPLFEAARAHEMMEKATVSGKIVLICSEQ